jgi:hypothetical protein
MPPPAAPTAVPKAPDPNVATPPSTLAASRPSAVVDRGPAPVVPAPVAEAPTPPAAAAVAIPTSACRVKVVSQPTGAEVLLAGRSLGHTPTMALDVPCGASLVLKRPRYQTAVTPTPTEASADVREIAAQLQRPAALLEVTSEPSGADVVMHGRTVGQTPAILSVFEYDSFQFEIQAEGFAPLKKQIYLRTTSGSFHGELVPASGGATEPP